MSLHLHGDLCKNMQREGVLKLGFRKSHMVRGFLRIFWADAEKDQRDESWKAIQSY